MRRVGMLDEEVRSTARNSSNPSFSKFMANQSKVLVVFENAATLKELTIAAAGDV